MGPLERETARDALGCPKGTSLSSVPAGQASASGTTGTLGTVGTFGTFGTSDTVDVIEERAGLAADSVPACFLDGWSRLNHQKPFDVSDEEWRRALDDGGLFLDAWGHRAAALDWSAGDLFDVAGGLVWRLAGARVVALGPEAARLNDGRTLRRVGSQRLAGPKPVSQNVRFPND